MRRREVLAAVTLGVWGARAQAQPADAAARVGVLQFGELTPERARYFVSRQAAFLGLAGGPQPCPRSALRRRQDRPPDGACVVAGASKPDLIVALGGVSTVRALRERTTTIPLVMVAIGVDPVEARFVETLSRPGGNVTGS
jgi:hypothetical protein